MEWEPRFEHRREHSLIEEYFGVDRETFERNLLIREKEVTRLRYSVSRDSFVPTPEVEERRGREVLWHKETATLIVPPPVGGIVQIGDLAGMTIPVVGFIKKQKPDIVVGCDRGARIYAVAIHSMWGKSQSQSFPTLDSRLRFARLSTSLGLDVTSRALELIVESSLNDAKRKGKGLNNDRPKIMFIDDWVSTGSTRKQILESLDQIGMLEDVDVCFAVMCGYGANVSGDKAKAGVFWHDQPEIIGVNYTKDGYPFVVRSENATKTRKKLHRLIREKVNELKLK